MSHICTQWMWSSGLGGGCWNLGLGIMGRGIEPGVSGCGKDGTSWTFIETCSLSFLVRNYFWTPIQEKTKIFSLLLDFCQNLHSTKCWRFCQKSYAKIFGMDDLNSKLLRFWCPHPIHPNKCWNHYVRFEWLLWENPEFFSI